MTSLIIELKLIVDKHTLALQKEEYILAANRRAWVNVWKESQNNPLPTRDYKLMTTRLAIQCKQSERNISFLIGSIESAKAQIKEIESRNYV